LPERDLGTQPGAFPVCTTCHVPVTVPGTGRGARRHVGLGLVQAPRSPQLCAFAPARGRRWCKTRHGSVAVPGTSRGCRVLGVSKRVRPGRLSVFPTRDQAGHRHTKGGARPGVRVHHPRPLTRGEPEFDPETSPRRSFRCHPICTPPNNLRPHQPARRRVAGRVLFASLHRCARGRGALSAGLKRQKVMLLGCSCY
jgi:hypothetical protein